MVVMRPGQVTFDGATWEGVERVVIDRVATRVVKEWSDSGPYPVFVDVPEQMVRVRVRAMLDRSTLDAPVPGEFGQLRVELGAGSDVGRRLVRTDAVVESVSHEASGTRAVRVVSLIAVSGEGDEDPIGVSDAS